MMFHSCCSRSMHFFSQVAWKHLPVFASPKIHHVKLNKQETSSKKYIFTQCCIPLAYIHDWLTNCKQGSPHVQFARFELGQSAVPEGCEELCFRERRCHVTWWRSVMKENKPKSDIGKPPSYAAMLCPQKKIEVVSAQIVIISKNQLFFSSSGIPTNSIKTYYTPIIFV